MEERKVNNREEQREIEQLVPPMPESTLVLLKYIAKGNKECEKIWEHISGCELCQFAVTTLVTIASEDNDEKGADSIELALLKLQKYKQRVSPEWNIDEFYREIEALPMDSEK